MKIHFLGTAASEGIPNPFCRCEHCQQARIRKGKNIRTHSSAIIDDQLLIDVAPEFSQQLLRETWMQLKSGRFCLPILIPIISTSAIFSAEWRVTDLRLPIR